MTLWGDVGPRALRVVEGVPLSRDGRFAKRPYGASGGVGVATGVGGVGEAMEVWVKPRERAMLGAQWAAK